MNQTTGFMVCNVGAAFNTGDCLGVKKICRKV